jgi:hypothetical protein
MVDNQDEKPVKRTRRVSSSAASKKEKPETKDSTPKSDAQESKPPMTENTRGIATMTVAIATVVVVSAIVTDDVTKKNQNQRFSKTMS